jgi:hypothetical protein
MDKGHTVNPRENTKLVLLSKIMLTVYRAVITSCLLPTNVKELVLLA